MATTEKSLTDLTTQLGHAFAHPELLQEALTHPSLAGPKARRKSKTPPYERLEFLGDRVLGLVIAEWLYNLFPDASEGELAKRHAALVNGDALHDIALDIGLDRHLRFAHGEKADESRKNLAALADAMEALIGALYLDGGLEPSKKFIQRYWNRAIAVDTAPADPKTALQEWAQGHALPLPVYRVIENSGPAHAPNFQIEVTVKGFPPATASGPSKRLAQKAAAQALLQEVMKSGK